VIDCKSALEWMYDAELSISDKVKEQVSSPIAILQLRVICVKEKHGLISLASTKNMD
jgi:hypothetical protein